jgi:gamma-glutamyltranspeptidase/glutathione hydrolase
MRDFQTPGRSPVFATNGMCATSHPLAAKVAIQMLEAGGNAVDAAIAGAVLLGFCEPQMAGIGGDCFVLMTPAGSNDVIALNGSGRAPAGLNSDLMRTQGYDAMPLHHAHAATTPGAIDAFCRLSKDHGKLGLKASLAPAIHYAEAGIPVAPRVVFDWRQAATDLKGQAREDFLLNDAVPTAGQMFRAPKQAEALRLIGLHGRDAFYEGEIAEDMVASLNALGGVHTIYDFADTVSDYTAPVRGTYNDVDLVEHPPNGQGATAILMLNMLKHFDISGMNPLGAQRIHIEAECAKLAYDARNRLIADPDHTTQLDHMLSPETAKRLAALVEPKRAMADPTPLSEQVHKDTVYITVTDRDRMSVSLIYSIFHSFGTGLCSDKFGILFQNRGAGFTLEQGHPNEAKGGKRPMHTIIPGMLQKGGETTMPFGVMGGAYQPHGHARFLSNMTDFGMDPQSAIDFPRAFSDNGTLNVERGYSDATRAKLTDLGHSVAIPEGPIGGAQAIQIHENGTLEGASDPRKDGCALGY